MDQRRVCMIFCQVSTLSSSAPGIAKEQGGSSIKSQVR